MHPAIRASHFFQHLSRWIFAQEYPIGCFDCQRMGEIPPCVWENPAWWVGSLRPMDREPGNHMLRLFMPFSWRSPYTDLDSEIAMPVPKQLFLAFALVAGIEAQTAVQ